MTVGEALAQARYRAGLSVDEVSDRTRIREAVIRGIEEDDYEACGGDLYVHGYVRAIAGAIGIDAQPLIREYDLRQASAPETPETPETPDTPEAADTPEASAASDTADTAAAAESTARAENPARGRTQRRVAAIVVLALVVVGTAVGLIVSGVNHHAQAKNAAAGAAASQSAQHSAGAQQGTGTKAAPGTATPATAPAPTPTAAKPKPVKARSEVPAAARIRALPIKLAEAFGADGLVDGDNPQIAMYAITRGAPLPWESQWYVTPEFGMLKTGTGLLLDMGRRVTITSVRIELGPYAGADLQLRAGNSAALSSLKVVTRANGVGGAVRFRLRSPRTARYVLLWFTLLPPNGAGQYQASVSRVVVNGHP